MFETAPWMPRIVFDKETETGTETPAPETFTPETPPETNPTAENPEGTSLITDGNGSSSPEGFSSDPITFTPETFAEDIKELIPENFEVDQEGMTSFLEKMNSANSRADLVRTALETFAEYQKAAVEGKNNEWLETQKTWKESVRTHPEYGGEKLDVSLANAKLVAQTYGGNDFSEFLKLTGTGNHPAMVAFLNKVHAEMPKESAPLQGNPPNTQPKSLADKIFGSSEK